MGQTLTTYYLLRTTYYLPTPYCLPLTTYYLLLTTSLLTTSRLTPYLLLTTYYLLLTTVGRQDREDAAKKARADQEAAKRQALGRMH